MQETVSSVPLRERIGQFASGIGSGALILALVGWLWQGGFTPVIGALLGVGIVGLILWISLSPREARALLTGRQVRYGTGAILSSLVLIGFIVSVYLVVQRSALTLDMTDRRDYTLSNATLTMLEDVTRSIQITGFYSPQLLISQELDDQIFRLYEVETEGLITRRYYDPQLEPALAAAFGAEIDGAVFVSYLTADGQVDYTTLVPISRQTTVERDTTVALSRLLARDRFRVYFERGFSNIDPQDTGQAGLTEVIISLEQNGIRTTPIDFTQLIQQNGLIPLDASAVVLTRANTDYPPQVIAILNDYLQRGGSLLIATDVLFTPAPLLTQNGEFNRYLWDNFGIRALDAAVVDAVASGQTQLDVGSFAVFPDLEIGSRLNTDANTVAQFRLIRAIEVNRDSPPVPNGQVIASSTQSYGETDFITLSTTGQTTYDSAQDLSGPFTLMAWARDDVTGAKILLVGDSDFITNGQIYAPYGNAILFADSIAWLTGYADQISIEIDAQVSGLPLMFISASMLDTVGFITQVLMPGVALLLGVLVWVRRRRR
ncbi:MAG: GldG family protein [Anaerolineae bacterium]|nr:GldG family protein [Anaerolineae bacterium]